MAKDLKLSFILFAVFSAIIMAWKTLMGFFSAAGVNFVAIIALICVLLLIMLKNQCVKNRIKDMFIVACFFAVMELFVYIPVEFGISSYNIYRGFMVYQNVITGLSILFFAYIAFRFVTEFLNVKFAFIEFILGNGTKKRSSKIVKERKSKELENGCLEEKPNRVNEVVEEPINQSFDGELNKDLDEISEE